MVLRKYYLGRQCSGAYGASLNLCCPPRSLNYSISYPWPLFPVSRLARLYDPASQF